MPNTIGALTLMLGPRFAVARVPPVASGPGA